MSTLYIILLVVLLVIALLAAYLLVAHHSAAKATRGLMFGGGAFRLKVSDPEYTALLDGKKTVEARLDRPPFARLTAGDPVVVVRSRPQGDTSEYPGGHYKFDAEVVRVTKYKNLEALLKGESLAKVYPGKSASEATASFSQYLPPDATTSDAVVAIELKAAKGAKGKHVAARYGAGYGAGANERALDDYDDEYDETY